MLLSRDGGGELEIDHEERDSLDDDRRTSAYAAHSLSKRPCGDGEYGSHRNVTHIQTNAHPEKTLEPRCARYIAKMGASPAKSRDRSDGETPNGHLNRELLEEWRLKAAHHHDRERRGTAKDRKTRPEQKAEQMLLLGAKERIGPHACDASPAPPRVEE
jgi:hypothetical protein